MDIRIFGKPLPRSISWRAEWVALAQIASLLLTRVLLGVPSAIRAAEPVTPELNAHPRWDVRRAAINVKL